MGTREFEAMILRKLREVANNQKILQRHIMEWSTGEIEAQEGETLYYLPSLEIHVAVNTNAK